MTKRISVLKIKVSINDFEYLRSFHEVEEVTDGMLEAINMEDKLHKSFLERQCKRDNNGKRIGNKISTL